MAGSTASPGEEPPARGWPAWLRIAALSVGAGGIFWGLGKREVPRAAAPLKTAYWYWHQPFQLDAAEQRQLAAARIERLYVLAGTVARRDSGLVLISKQGWKERSPVPVVGVLRVENAALALLLAPEGGARAAELLRSAGLPETCIGVQWDADVPTARLPDYRRCLEAIRKSLPENRLLGITALPDWLTSPEYAALCGAVDEIAPQFYGNSWPRDGREPPALWETDRLVEQVQRAAAGRARVWVGLPAYGRCLVADREGHFGGVRHDLAPEAMLDDPLWEVSHASTREATFSERGHPAAGEDTLLLRSREEALVGSLLLPTATSLWFQWPRVEGLRAAAAELATARITGVEGVCLFRWPVRAEPLSLAPVALNTEETAPATELSLRLERAGDRVAVVVRNEGADSPRLAGGLRVEVDPGRGEIVSRSEGAGFLGAERSSLLRADRVKFTRPLLRPGGEWTPCEVVGARSPVVAELHWRDARGPRVTGARLNPETAGKGVEVNAPR